MLGRNFYVVGFVFVFLVKLIYFFFNSGFNVGGGNDADYYHAFVNGEAEEAVNSWPIILFYLNKLGFYSRGGISFVLFLISSIVLPYLIAILCLDNEFSKKRIFWISMFVVGVYPVLLFYSLDIYRDVFMIFIFVLAIYPLKKINENNKSLKWLMCALSFSIFLYFLRGYLGFAYFISVLFSVLNFKYFRDVFSKWNFLFLVFFYFALSYVLFLFGVLDKLMSYREEFLLIDSGTTLGLNLNSSSDFLYNFLLSWLFQVFGIWTLSGAAVFLFFYESVPFILMFFYLLKSRKYMNNFDISLILFFVVYNSIWVLGNDNFGTAWRLRSFGYISIFIIFMNIRQRRWSLNIG